MALDRSMVRMYDIRGEVGRELTPEAARSIGQALVRLARERTPEASLTFAVGRDVRPSSDDLAAALIDGILGQGVAYQARFDPQAKGLGEWLRSRYVDIPEELLQ